MEQVRCSLNNLEVQDNQNTEHYVVKQETILSRLKGTCSSNIGKVYPGMLVEAIGTVENNKALKVRLSSETERDIWYKTEWKCHRVDLIPVTPIIWKLLKPISSLQERVRLANNKQLCKDVEDIKPGSKVWFCPESNDPVPSTYSASVKYIGPAKDLGSGYFFGLDLLDNEDISKPSELTIKYFSIFRKTFNCPGIFATLSSINPRKTKALEDIRNFEKNFMSNDILQPKTTDNFFISSNKDINKFSENKKNTNILPKNRYSSFVEKDNNNGIIGSTEAKVFHPASYPIKSFLYQEQNDNKALYKNLKSFDPLHSEHKWSSDVESNSQSDEVEKLNELSKINHQTQNRDYSNCREMNVAYNRDFNNCRDLRGAHSKELSNTRDSSVANNREIGNYRDLSIGSWVKFLVDNDTHYGVIRWIGSIDHMNPQKLTAAIELDDIHPMATDGTYQNTRYFNCSPRKAWFTDLNECHQYDMAASNCYYNTQEINDLDMQSPVIAGTVPPMSATNGDLERICGKYRGIQGHHNSCYLDATLFSMFAFTSAFDKLLIRVPNEKDCPEYKEVQRVLREEIVNPLRKNLFVKSDSVMKLRKLLEKSSSISGLTTEEKDPEEFLTSLVAQTLKAEPFLHLSSGQDAYHYQLFVEKDDNLVIPTVQQLLEQSFLTSNIKLKTAPSCLILQMPRFGKTFKMYPKIQPTLLLDITDIIEDAPRQCTVCGKLAKYECKECYGQCGEGLESIAFCKACLEKAHCHERRTNHEPKTLTVPFEYETSNNYYPVPRRYMELLAVVCIETSHYVSFVKCGPGFESPWCFFDSMADRKGEQNGYNIPKMVPLPDFPYWFSEEGATYLATLTDDRLLPEHPKRLLCDAYMCMYQTPDIMYK